MAGIDQLLFFLRDKAWTEMKSRSINSQKYEQQQYPAIFTEQAWSKTIYYVAFGEIFLAERSGYCRAGKIILLPARVANHSTTFKPTLGP